MRHILTIDSLQSFIGEKAKDPYGRIVGRVVSIESEIDGTVKMVAIEDEMGRVRFFEAERIRISDGCVVLEPDWKVEATKILNNYRTAIKRLKGLEEIYSKNSIPVALYKEMRSKLEASIERLKASAKKLKEEIKRRIREIEDENFRIDRALAELQVSYFAGEIGEKYYKIALDALRSAKDSNSKEIGEMKKILNELDTVIEGKYEPRVKSEAEEKPTEPAERERKEESSVQEFKPIPVKVVGLS